MLSLFFFYRSTMSITATGNITALNNYCGEILLRGKISAVFLRKD